MPNYYTDCKVVGSDKLSEKLETLEIDAPTKLSIMSGLLKVHGSADYLNKKEREIRELIVYVTLHIGTVIKSMTGTQLAKDKVMHHYQEVMAGCNYKATHVVRKIQYGANAIFTFRKHIENCNEQSKINDHLKMCAGNLKKILEGSAVLRGKCAEKDEEHGNGIECHFKSDFLIQSGRDANLSIINVIIE